MWRLSLRLTLSFAILIGAMIGVAWLAMAQSYRFERQFADLSDENHDEQMARQILNYSNVNARILMETFTTNDSNQLSVLLKRHDENSKIIDEMINEMSLSTEAEGESDLVALIQKRREVYRTNYLSALNVLREGQPEQARTLMVATVLPELTQYHDAVNHYISFQQRRIQEIQARHSASTAQARRQTLVLISIVVFTAGGIAIFVAMNTSRHIARRRLAEEALHAAHRELEDRIAERTAELRGANQQLQQEIGTRRSIEEELRSSEARYRQIVQTAEDMIYRLTPAGHITFVNAAAAKMVGRPAEEGVGMHFLTFTRHDFRARALSFYREQIKKKIPTTYLELPLLTYDQNELWVGQNVQLIIENDQVVSVQAVSRDVTQRKLVETQLLESEQRYRMLFESNPEPMWVYDEETLQFIAVNDAAVIQYGYSREEFLAMTIKEIRPDEDLSALTNRRAHVVDGYGSYDDFRTWRHRRKDGTIIEVEITWHTLEFLGRPAKLVLAKDVTERTRAQRELQYQKIRFQQLLE